MPREREKSEVWDPLNVILWKTHIKQEEGSLENIEIITWEIMHW